MKTTSRVRTIARRIGQLEAKVRHYDEREALDAQLAAQEVPYSKPGYWRTLSTKNSRLLEQARADLRALRPLVTDADLLALLQSRSAAVRLCVLASLDVKP